jgi:prolipoprotein diacylglyceryltransferase
MLGFVFTPFVYNQSILGHAIVVFTTGLASFGAIFGFLFCMILISQLVYKGILFNILKI